MPAPRFPASYRVLGKLGSGGMGSVLLVHDVATKTRRALKYCTAPSGPLRKRFEREVRAMQLVDHPNVVPVIACDLAHDPPYFLMPVAVRSLDQEIPRLVKDHVAALTAFAQICAGVAAIHRAVGPHRDLKPHNVLRFRDGRVAVSDFGLVKIEPRDTSVLTRATHLLGTDLYMAPEQRLPGGSRDASHLADVYALGATLFHLVTGKFPAVLDVSGLPPALGRVILRATAQLARERFQTVDKLAQAAADYLELLCSPRDPMGVFAERLAKVTTRLADTATYHVKDVVALLAAVRGLGASSAALVEEFDRVPDIVLEKAARRTPDALADALDAYVHALADAVQARTWAYAETVAERMRCVFDHAADPRLKATAVAATLIAAVDLHRFAAMDSLEAMILAVETDADARAVSEVLLDHGPRFAGQAARYQGANVHRFIRAAVRETLARGTARDDIETVDASR